MALEDKVTTTRGDIISMISCGYDYGHLNQISNHFFWGLLGEHLSGDEIQEYAKDLSSEDGYGEEDYEEVVDMLTRWAGEQR